MAKKTLKQKLSAAVANGQEFGPSDPAKPRLKVPAKTLRDVLLAVSDPNAKGLSLRNAQITGELDLAACKVNSGLQFTHCLFDEALDLQQAYIPDLAFLFCEFQGQLSAPQLTAKWNFLLSGSTLPTLSLVGAKIGGHLALSGAKVTGKPRNANETATISADGLEVAGRLMCNQMEADGEVSFAHVRVGGGMRLDQSVIRPSSVMEAGSTVLNLDTAQIGSDLNCRAIDLVGELWLGGAQIGGQLRLEESTVSGEVAMLGISVGAELLLRDATLVNESGPALNADRLTVDSSVYCDGNFTAKGGVRLPSAKIAGQLSLDSATVAGELLMVGASIGGELGLVGTKLENEGSTAFHGDRLSVKGGIYARNGFKVSGEVRLPGATIGDAFSITQATLENQGADAFYAEGIVVEGPVQWLGGCSVKGQLKLPGARIEAGVALLDASIEGEVQLTDASIGVDLLMNGSKLHNPDGVALNAERIRVGGLVVGASGFESGEVRLNGAKIGGLSLNDARLTGTKEAPRALSAETMDVGGSIFCDRMNADGQVWIPGSMVRIQVSFRDARLGSAEGEAMVGDGIVVGHGMYCSDGFEATAGVSLAKAQIGGQLSLEGASLKARHQAALNLNAASVDELVLLPQSVEGSIDLRQASTELLLDAKGDEICAAIEGETLLDGFTYRALWKPLDAEKRLKWIASAQTTSYYPGVYGELERAFRRIGHSGDARAVGIASERRARREVPLWSARRAWSNLLFVTIGYGYRNWLALIWLLCLIAAGSVAFCIGDESFSKLLRKPPDLDPVLYSIDATVPVLDLGQQKAWQATGAMAWLSLALAVSGYVLATAVIAAAAGLLNRDQR